MDTVKRGFSPGDKRDFSGNSLQTLHCAARDLYYLLNRGYPVKSASTFIGNHCLLSERQRIALSRAVSSSGDITARKAKQLSPEAVAGKTVHIDGFNQIITLEVAQSCSPVLLCMNGAYRDLAGLRGTYRLIDKTDAAIRLILAKLKSLGAARAVFWLDAPVSNSGRLKTRIAEIAEQESFEAGIEIVSNADTALYSQSCVASSDSVILDRCLSWLNLCEMLIPAIPGAWVIDIWEKE